MEMAPRAGSTRRPSDYKSPALSSPSKYLAGYYGDLCRCAVAVRLT